MANLSLEAFRWRFPLLGKRVYLNTCEQGALSIDVDQAFRNYLESWDAKGSPWDAWLGQVNVLRDLFARAIGADPDEVAIVPSASAGVSIVAGALDFDGPRRAVVMGDFEFPTVSHVWLAQERRGAAITWVRASGDELPVERYEAAIDERALVVPATRICFRNGYRVDLARLARVCRERGAYLFLDDYQCTGTAPIDVHALGVDFMITGALKYLLGSSGIAFLYVRRDLIDRLVPTHTGWFGRIDPFAFRPDVLDWAPGARRFEAGTPPVPNVYAAATGLRLLDRVGLDAVARRVESLTTAFLDGARGEGWDVMTPADPARRGPLCVVRSVNAVDLVRRLESRGIIASARGDGLRVSFHGYNNRQDVAAVLEGLRREAVLLAPAARL